MPPDVPKWLEDIRDATGYILSATESETVQSLANQRTLRQAVERNFEIIGEALNRISRADPSTASRLTDRQRIIAFRNILIHAYDHIDIEIVWEVIQHSLPKLRDEVEALLRESDQRP